MSTQERTLANAAKANALLNMIRKAGPAHVRAKAQFAGVEQVEPKRDGLSQLRVEVAGVRTLQSFYDYAMRTYPMSQLALSSDEFTIMYDIHCDISRDVFRSQHVMGMRVPVDWGHVEAECRMYPGRGSAVPLKPDVKSLVLLGVWDKALATKGTGFVKRETDAIDGDDGAKIINNFRAAMRGQDKLTRLVKGALLWMDLMEDGSTQYGDSIASVTYGTRSVAALADETAYVWSDQPGDDVYNAFIYAMCQEYPHPSYGGHAPVHIPADGDNILLMCSGGINPGARPVITAQLAYASLSVYAQSFRVTDQLEHALCIAASLRENRYLTTFGLPRVSSLVDAVYPCCNFRHNEEFQRTQPTSAMLKVFGRAYQSNLLMILKDAVSSAYNSSERGVSLEAIVDALKNSSALLEQMNPGALALNRLTCQLRPMDYLSEEDVEAIDNTSLFEGAWVIRRDPITLKGGAISRLYSGLNESIRGRGNVMTSREMLDKEIRLAGVAPMAIPLGHYTIVGQNMAPKHEQPMPRMHFDRRELPNPITEVAKPADPNNGTNGRVRPREGRRRVVRTHRTRVPSPSPASTVFMSERPWAGPNQDDGGNSSDAEGVDWFDKVVTPPAFAAPSFWKEPPPQVLALRPPKRGRSPPRMDPASVALPDSPRGASPGGTSVMGMVAKVASSPVVSRASSKSSQRSSGMSTFSSQLGALALLDDNSLMARALERKEYDGSKRAFPEIIRSSSKRQEIDWLAILVITPENTKDWAAMCTDAWARLNGTYTPEEVRATPDIDLSVKALVQNTNPERVMSHYVSPPTEGTATKRTFLEAGIDEEYHKFAMQCIPGNPFWANVKEAREEIRNIGVLVRISRDRHFSVSAQDVARFGASRMMSGAHRWVRRKTRPASSMGLRATPDDIDHSCLMDMSLNCREFMYATCTRDSKVIATGRLNQVLSLSKDEQKVWHDIHNSRLAA